MKPQLLILLALIGAPLAFAEDKHDHSKETKEEHAKHDHEKEGHEDHDDHDHEEDVKKGPNGGLLVESKGGFTLEVTVDKERKARVVFLDKDKKAAVALEAQTITGSAGERSAPVKLAFAKGKDADANVLISDKALPEGAHVPMILTIKTTADAKAVTERFELHLH